MSIEWTAHKRVVEDKVVQVTRENILDLAEHFGTYSVYRASTEWYFHISEGGSKVYVGDVLSKDGYVVNDQSRSRFFKAGDKVICVDADEPYTSKHLKYGETYTVRGVSPSTQDIYLEGIEDFFAIRRFVRA